MLDMSLGTESLSVLSFSQLYLGGKPLLCVACKQNIPDEIFDGPFDLSRALLLTQTGMGGLSSR